MKIMKICQEPEMSWESSICCYGTSLMPKGTKSRAWMDMLWNGERNAKERYVFLLSKDVRNDEQQQYADARHVRTSWIVVATTKEEQLKYLNAKQRANWYGRVFQNEEKLSGLRSKSRKLPFSPKSFRMPESLLFLSLFRSRRVVCFLPLVLFFVALMLIDYWPSFRCLMYSWNDGRVYSMYWDRVFE